MYSGIAMKYQVLEDTVEDITTETHDKASAGLPSMSQSDHVLNIQQLNIGKFSCAVIHTCNML